MILTTISEECINSITLPEKVTGQYWLYDSGEALAERLVSVEGVDKKWIIKSNRRVKVLGDDRTGAKSVAIEPMHIYPLQAENKAYYVYVEPSTEDRQIFTKYLVRDNIEIRIGRQPGNDICYAANAASSEHARLVYFNGIWHLYDDKSSNGTFVNEKRARDAELELGDAIFIVGLRIIIGKNFIALNNPDGKVTVSGNLIKYVMQPVEAADEDDEYELAEQDYFFCSPRFKRDIETAKFKIDSPPPSPVSEEMPWPLVIGSSMAMGMMSAVTLVNAIISHNVMSMVMGGSMLIGTLLLPLITKTYEKSHKRKKEALRQKKYREYLDKMALRISEECKSQEEILKENFIPIRECESRILNVTRNLWERTMQQNDFLCVRVGLGDGQLNAEMQYQEKRFSIDDDILQEELFTLCDQKKVLHNIPVTYSLFENYVSAAIGPRDELLKFAKGIIFQIASFYSYDDLKMVFLYDKAEQKEFEFVKWLPHVWNDEGKFRFIATDSNEVKEVSSYLDNIIAERIEISGNEMEDVVPYYIIFSMSKDLAMRSDALKKVLEHKENIHMSVLAFYDELKNVPKESSIVVEIEHGKGRLFDKNDISGKSQEFTPDIYLNQDPLDLSVRLANIKLDSLEGNFTLPRMITFMELFGVGKVEHLNALARWKENDPTKSLAAEVGVDTLGETFMLDLHEKYHGPHGLVAGMTGSGKSEFIITYILSLAVNYHPNEVAFILIDYKGGGMAKSFEHLPHTAGIITNLDGSAIKRSLVSIESELKRRQAIFGEASKKVGVSNIDIYKYQKLYREGTVSEPLQHLFIISDEFAELKTQQPEFMTQLVSAARIGRSLGVHLILATQKPSGVVDDQIWSNSKFRVCLKVQERADSQDMLKRPDAAELTDTGRFYLQVGYNELFELGQSAWAGAPYYPSDKVVKEKDDSVAVIDTNGRIVKEVKIDRKKSMFGGNAKKQLDVITEYLRKTAEDEHIKIRPLWLEPIAPIILLDNIRKKYGTISEKYKLNPVIGEYDDPAHQRQCVLRLPISEEGNVVVYGVAGSGKTTFINAMVYSLIHEHTPDEVTIYILDFAAETLRAFEKAPHVGDVILSFETEKVSNLFKMLLAEAEKRKKLFADYGGDYHAYNKASGNPLPSIVVTICNFAAFTEMFEEKEEAVSFLSREGTKYGIYFVLTSLGTGGVRFRLLQNFKQLFVLQLNDESDYSTVVGKTEGLFPAKYKGRGLVRTDSLYEFQVASLCEDDVPFAFIQSECKKLAENWNGKTAERVPILPKKVDADFLSDYIGSTPKNSLPVGVEKGTLKVHYYPFANHYINMALSLGEEYQEFVEALARFIGSNMKRKGYVFDLAESITEDTGAMKLVNTAKDADAAVAELFEIVLHRNNTYKDAKANGTECEKFEDLIIVINSLDELKKAVSDENNEKLSLVLAKGSLDYNIFVIIGEKSKFVSSITYEPWYKSHVSQSDGIWIGRGITEQYQMKPNKTTGDMHEDIDADFGYSLIKGKPVRIKLLNERNEEEDNYE